ncbi:MAG TPA: hypothetical protein VKA18_07360 [Alphaproteobacteria bacterium]|nr:hypothetical protein [Alphaproteobacteria bacterium]
MRNIIIGLVVAVAVILAFYFGVMVEEQEGPVEEIGETIEEKAE